MRKIGLGLVAALFLVVLTLRAGLLAGPAGPAVAPPLVVSSGPMSYADQDKVISQYCGSCHNKDDLKGELSLDDFKAATAGAHAEIAEKMVRKLRTGMMPPSGHDQPDAATRAALITALETTLDKSGTAPPPGRRTFQRLNRAEYGAAIRALFGVSVDVEAFLPADTISASFDNIADVQMPSATVMQGYLRAAAHISRVVMGDPSADPTSAIYEVPRTRSQKDRVEGAPFGTRGGTSVVHNFPADGDYKFQMLLHGAPEGELFGRTVGPIHIEVAIDGARVALVKVDRWISESSPLGLAVVTDPIPVTAGSKRVSAAFLREFEGVEDDFIRPVEHTLADTQIGLAYGVTVLPHLRNLAITGPANVRGVSDNPTRAALLTCRPATAAEELPCARRILERVATIAYRRPVSAADMNDLLPFYTQGTKTGGFDNGIRTAVQAVLSSLHFLFRLEEAPASGARGGIYRVSDVDLASRLSFFLWGTIPDQPLIDAAGKGQLSKPDVFEQQVRRMLADPRSEALATRFAAQWLRLQDLDKVEPDALDYPYFDETLAASLTRETEVFFDHLVRADRPLLELLTADYTFVNERLARHYGIQNVSGPAFRRVQYPDTTRRGILGHGSILTLTSHGNRTSPVLRGKWILEVLLGSPPPAPPPNVPDLEEAGEAKDGRLLSVAEQLAKHRANPACSSCHNVIDPIGLSLDNFDVDGAWRIKDRGVAVQTSSVMYDGTPLNGIADLRAALLRRSEVITSHFTESLMAYALGRRIEAADMPAIRRIVREAAKQDYKMSALILGVVKSPAFSTALGTAPRPARQAGKVTK
jgi:mono/diheme cytochrome c family protein